MIEARTWDVMTGATSRRTEDAAGKDGGWRLRFECGMWASHQVRGPEYEEDAPTATLQRLCGHVRGMVRRQILQAVDTRRASFVAHLEQTFPAPGG